MRATLGLSLAFALAATGCPAPEPGPHADAEALALQLFDLARQPDPPVEELDRLFGAEPDEQRRARLYDALAGLAGAIEPRVVQVEVLEGLERRVVDLEADLPGGGVARFTVQLETGDSGEHVVWFAGPGVEWPQRRRRGDGLSISAPPDGPGG